MFSRNEITSDRAPVRPAYPWHELEEYGDGGGMWAIPTPSARAEYAEAAADLMCDPQRFADSMRRALSEWPRSVSVALTTPGMNQRAWLGHAGCYLDTGSPEETTRIGWHSLDDGEQYGANAAADQVIAEWRKAQAAHVEPHLDFGGWDA